MKLKENHSLFNKFIYPVIRIQILMQYLRISLNVSEQVNVQHEASVQILTKQYVCVRHPHKI